MLQGASNFRDLGGMVAAGGKKIRNGVLFRSNSLARVTVQDMSVLDGCEIRTIIDLRSCAERERSPALWQPAAGETLVSAKPDTESILHSVIGDGMGDTEEWRRRFSGFFADIPELYAREYSSMFVALAAGRVPLLVNCSAGKDRTGVAVLLLLTILGVPFKLALKDYLLSADRLNGDTAFVEMLTGKVLHGFANLPSEARAVMLGVHEAHARAALDAVSRNYGSVERYAMERLSLARSDLDLIRSNLLVPVQRRL